jgi:PEP-CTERM motif-containing protein
LNAYEPSDSASPVRPLRIRAFMSNLNRGWNRRRWILAPLFIVLMTVSMMGPTQALSGVMTASVVVTEAFNAMLGNDPPSRSDKPAAPWRPAPQWFDNVLANFQELVGDGPAPRTGGVGSTAMENPVAATSSAAAGGTTSQLQPGGHGYGAPGWPGHRGGAGSGPGLGSLGAGGGIPIDSLASTHEALAQGIAVRDIESSASMSALDTGIAEEPGAGGSGATGGPGSEVPGGSGASGPGSGAGEPGSGGVEPGFGGGGGDLPGLSASPGLQLTPPGSSLEDQGPGSTPYADGTVPPAVIQDLLDDLNVPNPQSLGNAPNATEGGGGFDVTQVPEPSTLILLTLGMAALRHRSRQRKSGRA